MSAAHWPWWLAAAAMAVVTVASCLVGRRPFGVSGILGRLLDWRAEAAAERCRTALASAGDEALEAALLAATAEAFAGMTPALEAAGAVRLPPPVAAAEPAAVAARPGAAGASCGACAPRAERPPLGAHAVFLGAIVAGGFVAATLRGGFQPTLALPEAYARLVAPGLGGFLGLGAGGLLIGLGTSVSGGCSTGHGLTGCARLQPAGLAATATFFGLAVAVSFLLAGRAG